MKEYKRFTTKNWRESKHTKAYEYLAELEDKIEQGLMLELPCKVGDTVYRLLGYNNYDKWTVDKINTYVTKSGYDYCLVCLSKDCGWECFYEEDKGVEWSFEKPKPTNT
jgi:hypothetical protein